MAEKRLTVLHQDDLNYIPVHLMKLADPSLERIHSYLETGSCTVAYFHNDEVGVLVTEKISDEIVEIKNMVINPDYQGQGFGKELLEIAVSIAEVEGYKTLRVCTGNSSIGPLAFYQKGGFQIVGINANYFLENYEDAIFEDGIQCKHQIVLEKILQ